MKLYTLIPKVLIRSIINLSAHIKYRHITIKKGANAGFRTIYEGYNLLNKKSKLQNCYVGLGTYVSGNTLLYRTRIGRFCSIGQNVKNGFASHPTEDWASTHPAFFSTKKQAGFTFVKTQLFGENKFADSSKKWYNIIGNDVWIGNDVKLMPGITIGDGAIIATGAIVTKDVEPYSIVGGVPAKIIKYRFDVETIEYLQSIRWWEKDMEWLKNHAELFKDLTNLKNKIKS